VLLGDSNPHPCAGCARSSACWLLVVLLLLRAYADQKIFSSTMAAMGRQLKQSVNVFHSLML